MRSYQPPADTRFYAGADLPPGPSSSSSSTTTAAPSSPRTSPPSPNPSSAPSLPAATDCSSPAKDAEVIARLLKGGNSPPASAYPKERRGLRDRLHARLRLVRQRAELDGHVHTARRQANLPPVSNDVTYVRKRAACTADIADPFVRRRVETHLTLLEPLDTAIRRLEKEIADAADDFSPTELALLQSTPGVGLVLSLTILLEIDTIDRFDTRQQFCSYARLCGAVQTSDNKRGGAGNRKAGNAWLKGTFSEAAVLAAQKDERIAALLARLASKLGTAKALSALAHQLGRALTTCCTPRKSSMSTAS